MEDDSIDMGDDSINMGDDSIDMGYLVTLKPRPTATPLPGSCRPLHQGIT
jgi:hypothetical protein